MVREGWAEEKVLLERARGVGESPSEHEACCSCGKEQSCHSVKRGSGTCQGGGVHSSPCRYFLVIVFPGVEDLMCIFASSRN